MSILVTEYTDKDMFKKSLTFVFLLKLQSIKFRDISDYASCKLQQAKLISG